jgi:hypothetical protein
MSNRKFVKWISVSPPLQKLDIFSPLIPLPTVSRLTKNVYECIGVICTLINYLLILTLCSPTVSTFGVFIAHYVVI